MYIGKIEADTTGQAQIVTERIEPRGSFAVGLLFLAVAIPYWGIRLLATALWRDLRRVGRFVRLCGASYLEAARKQ
jgi:hypothetical protein